MLAQIAAVLRHKRGASVAAVLLISGGCYTYYVNRLAVQHSKRSHRWGLVQVRFYEKLETLGLFYIETMI